MGLLTQRQRLLVRRMSPIVINENFLDSSSDQEQGSYEEENKPIEKEFLQQAVKKIARSKDKTDQRFVDLFRTSQAQFYRITMKKFRDIDEEEMGVDPQIDY